MRGKLNGSEVGGALYKSYFNMTIVKLNNRLPYNSKLKERARSMRKNMTEPEKKLWFWFLKNYQKSPLSFQISPLIDAGNSKESENRRSFRIYRQRPIDNFIVDFYIPTLKIVIEIDGDSHFTESWIDYDNERSWILEWLWLEVLRFTNDDIIKNFDGVCNILERRLIK